MERLAVELHSQPLISSFVVPYLGVSTPHPRDDPESELSDHFVAFVNEPVVGQCPPFKQLEKSFNLFSLPVRDCLQLLLPHESANSCECNNCFLLALEKLKVVLEISVCKRKLPFGKRLRLPLDSQQVINRGTVLHGDLEVSG